MINITGDEEVHWHPARGLAGDRPDPRLEHLTMMIITVSNNVNTINDNKHDDTSSSSSSSSRSRSSSNNTNNIHKGLLLRPDQARRLAEGRRLQQQ